ncbi:hypothetical protein [Mucilaginibacter sp. BT774]|uniref:hypothetical protein n=1 Tax=Mucilaginibacter sp. BT774 TaxID=3062276 RepID=UPI002674B149|nr:hypothetical protein [Mucilaginibacter sp. BT774]MDO3627583.1 hypothetical protein [Mucilaginibacter sp. BT774]
MKLTYIYYALLVACFIYSLYFLQDYKVKVLAILLFLSIATEILAEINIYKKVNYYVYYHGFTIVEYGLISGILYQCIRDKLTKIILLISIPVFSIVCALIMIYVQNISESPSISGGLEGTLLIIWCLRAFYDLDPVKHGTIFQQPPFWFIMAFYSYYCIVTPFNCFFNTLQADPHYLALSTKAFAVINNAANYLLYILCMIGLSCLKQVKYTRQSSSSR